MDKLLAIWNLFREGQSVADPQLWKKRQIDANALTLVLVAAVEVARTFGLEVPVDRAEAASVAAGVLAVVNVVLTVTTSDKVGLPPKG